MAFMSVLIMMIGMLLFVVLFFVLLGVLTLGGTTLLTVGIVYLRRNKKAGNRIVAPVISIVMGAIMLLPVLIFIMLFLYGIFAAPVVRLDDVSAILRI